MRLMFRVAKGKTTSAQLEKPNWQNEKIKGQNVEVQIHQRHPNLFVADRAADRSSFQATVV